MYSGKLATLAREWEQSLPQLSPFPVQGTKFMVCTGTVGFCAQQLLSPAAVNINKGFKSNSMLGFHRNTNFIILAYVKCMSY